MAILSASCVERVGRDHNLLEGEQLLGVHVGRGHEQHRLHIARGEVGVVVETPCRRSERLRLGRDRLAELRRTASSSARRRAKLSTISTSPALIRSLSALRKREASHRSWKPSSSNRAASVRRRHRHRPRSGMTCIPRARGPCLFAATASRRHRFTSPSSSCSRCRSGEPRASPRRRRAPPGCLCHSRSRRSSRLGGFDGQNFRAHWLLRLPPVGFLSQDGRRRSCRSRPGTAPLIRITPSSSRTCRTRRFCTVTRSSPM